MSSLNYRLLPLYVRVCVCVSLAKGTPELNNAPLLAAFESRHFYFD